MFRSVNNIHFVGIGGIGMSGIAELLLNLGFQVSGSDLNQSDIINRLHGKGAVIFQGHEASNVRNCDVLVYSSAVRSDNAEIIEAKTRGIPVIRRAEMLGELIALKETSIAVAGTHGKTSTSSMVGAVLSSAKFDPTLVVGGLVQNINTNSLLGSGKYIVVEADEFDRSFLALRPTVAIVTNIELEHTDCYQDIEDLQKAFIQFCNSVPFYGNVIICNESPALKDILPKIKRPIIRYGFSPESDFSAVNLKFEENKTHFTVMRMRDKLGSVTLQVPGRHNVLNALAAITLGMEMGVDFDTVKAGIESYNGVRRRFEIKGVINDIMVVDDYAHHPTEVAATLDAALQGWNRRIIAVFQPHLFSRTQDFYRQFAEAFMQSQVLIVTDVYPAREDPVPGVTGDLVVQSAKKLGHKNVYYVPNLDDLIDQIRSLAKPGDMVLTIGAGTIWRYNQEFYQLLQDKA